MPPETQAGDIADFQAPMAAAKRAIKGKRSNPGWVRGKSCYRHFPAALSNPALSVCKIGP
jgi:hypothetical protein